MTAGRTATLVVLGGLAVAGVAISMIYQPQRAPEERIPAGMLAWSNESIAKARPQQVRERSRQERAFRKIASIGSAGETPLMLPVHVRIDAEGCVYVLDWSARVVKKFGPEGEYVMQFGQGEGKAPGEFANLSDFDIAPDGSLWACDPVNGLLTVFEADGSVRTTMRPERPPHRIALVRADTFAVISSPVGDRMFRVHGPGGRVIADCGAFMEQQSRLGIVLDGRIAATGSGGFAYAAYRAGILAVSTDRGDAIAVCRETLEHGGLPDVFVSRSGETEYARVDPDAPVITRSISSVGDELHLLAGADGSVLTPVMDVYDGRTGSYRYSYDLPADAVAACVTRTRLAAISDTTVTVWERVEHPPAP